MVERFVKVYVDNVQHQVQVGTPIVAVLGRRGENGKPLLGAVLNNRLVSLSTPIRGVSYIRPVTDEGREGQIIYRRSISLVLAQALQEVVPNIRLSIGQSLGEGYFFELVGDESIPPKTIDEIAARMHMIIDEDRPFITEEIDINEAVSLFSTEKSFDCVRLLKILPADTVAVVSLGGEHHLLHGPVALTAGGLNRFKLEMYNGGLILQFPSVVFYQREVSDTPRLFKVYRDTRRWNEIIGVSDVGQFNELCIHGGVGEIVKVSEGLHEKKVAEIADRVLARKGCKLILVAGPSASGKTTFAKRLSIQLRVNGVRPIALSLDDYYVDRDKTPRDANGILDFEALEAIDLALLNEHFECLLNGEKVYTPKFDFAVGRRVPKGEWRSLQLGNNDVLIVEGIHGLNERLSPAVTQEHKFRCYVSALTQLKVDNHERVFTSDSRLLRRIVRDRRYRGYSAERTIDMWPSVRRGEQVNIFPFQEQADAIFNSALVYEAAVLKTYAERFLRQVPIDSAAYVEANRLLRFLSLFVAVFPEEVPHTSILREFIGGSSFSY
ncbi:MAG: nucleoside kinase [Deltaproteobacteria bacterium]|nr:nucleoside kinase [Deltaproteobacteria bacterium]